MYLNEGGNGMSVVIMLCGKICSGKSTYAEKIKKERNAVVLSCDDLMLSLFDEKLGDKHDCILEKCKEYLYELACQIAGAGTNVILDFGFWTRKERKSTVRLFHSKNIKTEIHYIKIDRESWLNQINKRNSDIKKGIVKGYYVDENMKNLFDKSFEEPDKDEIDVIIEHVF